MASRGKSDEHSPFSSLQILHGLGKGGDQSDGDSFSVRSDLLQPPSTSERNLKKMFDYAREVLRESEEWSKKQEDKCAERKERDDLMKISLEACAPKASSTASVAICSRAECNRTIVAGTPGQFCCLACERSKGSVHSEACNQTNPRGTAVVKAAGTSSNQVIIIITFPDGKEYPCSFKTCDSGFDVYAKAHELGKEVQPREMKVIGPRGSSSVNKVVDAEDWGSTLASMGLAGGSTYNLTVKY